MSYTPDQGDIVWLDFDPSASAEIMKRRPAFVMSKKIFNQHTGLVVVSPITNTIKQVDIEVVLPKTLSTQGAVLAYQFKSLDFRARNCKLIEKAPPKVVKEVKEVNSIATIILS